MTHFCCGFLDNNKCRKLTYFTYPGVVVDPEAQDYVKQEEKNWPLVPSLQLFVPGARRYSVTICSTSPQRTTSHIIKLHNKIQKNCNVEGAVL